MIFANFSVHVTCGRGSVLLWRRSDMLYTSGFMDDKVAQRRHPAEAHAQAILGLAINCAQ